MIIIINLLIKLTNYFENLKEDLRERIILTFPSEFHSFIISLFSVPLNFESLNKFLIELIRTAIPLFGRNFEWYVVVLDLLSDVISESITEKIIIDYFPRQLQQGQEGGKNISINKRSNMFGGKITGDQWAVINDFIDSKIREWQGIIKKLMIDSWNSPNLIIPNPLNTDPSFYISCLADIFRTFPDISEKDKKSLEKSFKSGGCKIFSKLPVNTRKTTKRTPYNGGEQIPSELKKIIDESISQLNNCLGKFKSQLDVLRSAKQSSSIKPLIDKKIKLPDYPGLEDDIIVFNNVTKMVATAGLMSVGFINSDADILRCPYASTITADENSPARWRGINNPLLQMEIDILFKEVVSNQYRIFDIDQKLVGASLDERLELGIKKIYSTNNRVIIGDGDARDDINARKPLPLNDGNPGTYSQAIFSNTSEFFRGNGMFQIAGVDPANYYQPSIYIDNALQKKNTSLFSGSWPEYTLCNIPGFIDGWDAQCAWSTCDNPEATGDVSKKVKELPQVNASMSFEINSQNSGGVYTSILQRRNDISSTGLVIQMNTSLSHLGIPFGFICPSADIASSAALEATRVYDKQLQILLFKFKQYRENLILLPEKPYAYSNLFKNFLTDSSEFSAAGSMQWKDGSIDANGMGKNPFVHFAEYGLWKACADNSIISSAVYGQNSIYQNVQPIQSVAGIIRNFQNPLQKDRTMIQAGTDRPAQMGQSVAIYLEALDGSEINDNLLIGHNSRTENSYFYILPRTIWPYLQVPEAIPGFGGAKRINKKNNKRIKMKIRTIRKYKKAIKYNSYKKISKEYSRKKQTRKYKKKIFKKYSR